MDEGLLLSIVAALFALLVAVVGWAAKRIVSEVGEIRDNLRTMSEQVVRNSVGIERVGDQVVDVKDRLKSIESRQIRSKWEEGTTQQ